MTDVDCIVIGSGAGGLTAAVAQARAGERVLVLEQHYLPGGWCHSFDLGGYSFSPGVHYIGECHEGGRMRQIYEGLGVANDLVFLELDPDGFDKVRVGDVRFDIPKGKDTYIERLSARFPHEAAGIRGFLNLMGDLSDELATGVKVHGAMSALTLPARCPNLLRHGLRPLGKVLDRFVEDPVVRTILTVQAGDYGLGPSEAPAALHAAVVGHYFEGGYYPKGGARALPKAFIKELRRHGGQIKVRAEVSRILTEGRRAIGVRLADGTEIRAKRVISNADPAMTFGRLIDPDVLPRRLRWRMRRTTYGISAISLFMAAEIDAGAAGIDSGNMWYVTRPDIDETYRFAHSADPLSMDVPGVFLTCTTCKDPSKLKAGVHTFEAFSFVSWDAFRGAMGSTNDRPEAYESLKAELGRRIMQRIDELVPGLSERVVFSEIGSPLTNEYYVAAHKGSLYGTHKSLLQIGPLGWPVNPPIENLYLCGASTMGHGVAGATMSGLAAAKHALGCRTGELLQPSGQQLRVWPCDHPEQWPQGKAVA